MLSDSIFSIILVVINLRMGLRFEIDQIKGFSSEFEVFGHGQDPPSFQPPRLYDSMGAPVE